MSQKKLLLIMAHPDDETFGHAGTIRKYHDQGVYITLVTATRGEKGQLGDPPVAARENLGEVREKELRNVSSLLGIDELTILNYKDGEIADTVYERLVGDIETHLRRIEPDVVITFGPFGITGHPDHRTLSRAVTETFKRQRATMGTTARLYYAAPPPGMERPERPSPDEEPESKITTKIDVTAYKEVKISALRTYLTQQDAQQFATFLESQDEIYEYLHRAQPEFNDSSPLEENIF